MFGIGFGEFMLIMIVALLVIGPDKLPGIARSVAKAFNELKRTGNELKRTVTELNVPDPAKVAVGIRNAAESVADGIKQSASAAGTKEAKKKAGTKNSAPGGKDSPADTGSEEG